MCFCQLHTYFASGNTSSVTCGDTFPSRGRLKSAETNPLKKTDLDGRSFFFYSFSLLMTTLNHIVSAKRHSVISRPTTE